MKYRFGCWTLLAFTLTQPAVALGDALGDAVKAIVEKDLQTAQPQQSGEAQLTLEEALAIALRDNLGLASKSAQRHNKQATASASMRKMLPTLAVNSSRSDILLNTAASGSQAETFATSLTVTQPLYRGGALWTGWQSAKTQERQAHLDVIHAARTLTKDVKAAWYTLLEKRQLLKEAEAAMDRLHQHEKNAQAFFREGRIWRNEILQASVKVAQGEQNLITAQNQVEVAKAELNRLMRRPMDHPLDATGELTWTPLTWTLEKAYDHARQHRTDLKKAQLEIEVGKMAETTTASATLPSVTLTGTYNLDAPRSNYHENDATLTALLAVNWTAWNWGQTSQEVAAAKATTLKNQLTHDDQLQSVMLETRKAFLAARESAVKIEVIKKSLQQSEENYRVNQIRYREQLGTATDVLDAMDMLTNSRNTYTSALAAYLTSMAALDLAVGVGAQDLENAPHESASDTPQ